MIAYTWEHLAILVFLVQRFELNSKTHCEFFLHLPGITVGHIPCTVLCVYWTFWIRTSETGHKTYFRLFYIARRLLFMVEKYVAGFPIAVVFMYNSNKLNKSAAPLKKCMVIHQVVRLLVRCVSTNDLIFIEPIPWQVWFVRSGLASVECRLFIHL